MSLLKELALFEISSKEQRAPDQKHWWDSVQRGKSVPYPFGRGIRMASDAMLLCVVGVIGFTTRAQWNVIIPLELLFLTMIVCLLVARMFKHPLPAVGTYLVVVCLATLLNLAFPGMWGSVGLYTLCFVLLYAFPLRWSVPLAGLCIVALVVTNGAFHLLPLASGHTGDPATLIFNPLLAGMIGWIGWTLRTQYMLIVQLHEVQEQLREHMVRSEELATERERTRIARDIHDVLSHSLAVLSIQVQALRHVAAHNPEQLGAKLDAMATLIRESIAESRSVVGLLREKPPLPNEQNNLGADLRALAVTFSERTGIYCRFEENGTPHLLNMRQWETLQLALRELLTNAHRHGAAQTVWITLRWREASLIVTVSDDGKGAATFSLNTFVQEGGKNANGHHGLQGMCERLEILGGEVAAEAMETGGFSVTLRLPFEQEVAYSTQKERTA